MIKPKGDVSRLAKWAQQYIDSLRRRVDELEKRVHELSVKHPNSNVVLAGHHVDPDVELPPDSRIYFYAGDSRDRLTNMIEVHHDRDNPRRLYIVSYGSRGVHIIPSASNSFYLEMEHR